MDAIKPPALNLGDTIGVFAPSSWVDKKDIEQGAKILEENGFNVFIHPQTYERENQSAGNHLQKTLAFQGLWLRQDIKAIWAAGGGNRCLHLLDNINFKNLRKSPKLLIGFSDVTALLNTVTAKTNIITLHGPVLKNLHKHKEHQQLFDLLKGKKIEVPFQKNNIITSGDKKIIRGHLIGGNLSIFQYLSQMLPETYYDGAILFLEDCNEELSRIDRMLLHMRRSGMFKNIKAIILGEFTDIPETGKPFGYTLQDLIHEHTEDKKIAILNALPFGHGEKLTPLPIGAQAEIDFNKNRLRLLEACTHL